MTDPFNIAARFQSVIDTFIPGIESLGLMVAGVGLVMMVSGLILGSRRRFMAELAIRGAGLVCLGLLMVAVSAAF